MTVLVLLLLLAPYSGPQAQPAATPRARLDAAVKTGDFPKALQAYDDHVKATGKPDASALAVIAKAMLRSAAGSHRDQPLEAVPALERLARAGDGDARETLKALAKQSQGFSPEALAPLVALSRLGDVAAQTQLGERLVAAPFQQRVAVLQAVEAARATAAGERVAVFLGDGEAGVRAAAATAVGALGYTKAIPVLERMVANDVGLVRAYAAIGLTRLGQRTGETIVAAGLDSPVPELRLTAASAYEDAKPGPWLEPVKALLKDPDPISRVRAARIVACCDPAAAKVVLVNALASENPAVRAEAAEALEQRRLMDAPLARKLLADAAAGVAIPAAGAAAVSAR